MADIILTAGQLPPPACGYATEQDRLEAYVAAIDGTVEDTGEWQASLEEPADLTKYWLQVDADGRQVAVLRYSVADGRWVRWRNVPATDGFAAGVPDAYTLTFSNPFNSANAYADGRRYIFTAPFTNAGPATVNVDGVNPINIRKFGDTDLAAGDIEIGQPVDLLIAGSKAWLQTPVPIAVPDEVQIASISGLAVPAASGATTVWAHGLGVRPKFVSVTLVCADAGGDAGYSQNDEIDYTAVQASVGANENATFAVMRDATNVTVICPALGQLYVHHKTSGAVTNITPGDWTISIEVLA